VSTISALATVVRHRFEGTGSVDEWGMDPAVVTLGRDLAHLRWQATVSGVEHVPERGPALLVANRRPLGATPLLVAAALGHASGRAVRFAGLPDVAPAGPLLRRLGGVLARPDEVAGVLRAGHVVTISCAPRLTRTHRVGPVPPHYLAAALAEDAPVLPVAVMAPPLAHRVRLEVGVPIPSGRARGPLAIAELEEDVRGAIQRMVDEAGPPSWLLSG
jgi:hypothetical protein